MKKKQTFKFKPVKLSLADLTSERYVESAAAGRQFLTDEPLAGLKRMGKKKVDFFPVKLQNRLKKLLNQTGTVVGQPLKSSAKGASTIHFNNATAVNRAPVGGLGYYRLGEDGVLYQMTKSEHYHAPLGHSFPGYQLLEVARALGIPNATHNNTRGYITRVLEKALVKAAGTKTLDRVLNLETGSLAVEAALKMALARFYKSQADSPAPVNKGKVPVIVTIGNDQGGFQANYHGTTILTQTMRGMWPELYKKMEDRAYKVVPVRPNNKQDLKDVFERYNKGKYKVAAFFHEIVMMNYGGIVLTPDFLKTAYRLAKKCGAATIDDEIQSCLWHHDLFMFKEWGLEPDFVAVGKGFPGGEYPASRIIFNSAFDSLPQFGALVTNGQEEIASLAYLVTMTWAKKNGSVTRKLGDYFEQSVRDIADNYPKLIAGINGKRHMIAITFKEVEPAKGITAALKATGIDISVQTYKTEVPPAALLKLPLIMDKKAIDRLCKSIDTALKNEAIAL